MEFFNLKRLAYRMKTKTNAMMSHIVHSMLCKRGFSTYFHRFGVFVYSGKWRKKNSVSKSIRKRAVLLGTGMCKFLPISDIYTAFY